MNSEYIFKFTDQKELSKELEFTVACEKVKGGELLLIRSDSEETTKFKVAAEKILKGMKRDGVIKLFVGAADLFDPDRMEGVYLLNKYPELSQAKKTVTDAFYIKI